MPLYMVRCLPAPNKEPGENPGQFADYCKKLRFVPALRAQPLGPKRRAAALL